MDEKARRETEDRRALESVFSGEKGEFFNRYWPCLLEGSNDKVMVFNSVDFALSG